MGMTMTQKILAAHCGLDKVEAGQLIEADLDLVLGNDVTSPVAIGEMKKMNVRGKYGPRRVHRVSNGKTARNGRISGRYWCCTADKERKSAAIFRSARNCKLCA